MKDTDKKTRKSVGTNATDCPETNMKDEVASDKDTDIIEKRLQLVEILKEVFSIFRARILNSDYDHLFFEISDDDFPSFLWRITAQYDGTPGPPEVFFTIGSTTLSTDEIIAANRELPEPNCERIRQHKP